MEKIALITDSISDVDKETLDKYSIKMMPMKIIYPNEEFLDRVTITPQEVYDRMPELIPTTSLPSAEDMDNILDKIEKDGYTHAIIICVSSNLSGTYNAIKLVSEQHHKIKFHIFDSKTISVGEGCIVHKCAELIKKGEKFEKIVGMLPKIRQNVHMFFIIDTLEYLKKGGRIGKVAGTIGQILNIKPIISVSDDGKYYTFAKTRSKKQASKKILEVAKQILERCKCKIYVMHGGAPEECKNLLKQISNIPNIIKLYTGEISASAGVHTGPGLLGVALLEETNF